MDMLTMFLIAVVLWFVWSILQSYRSLEKELREIRVKCVMQPSSETKDPVDTLKNTVVYGLASMAKSI